MKYDSTVKYRNDDNQSRQQKQNLIQNKYRQHYNVLK